MLAFGSPSLLFLSGTRLSYILRGDEGRRDLWVIDVRTGEKRVLVSYEQLSNLAPSPEQATTDERERTRLTRYAVAAYLGLAARTHLFR